MSLGKVRYTVNDKILETLFETCCSVPEDFFTRNEVEEQNKKIEDLVNIITTQLKEDQQVLLEKLLDVQSDLDALQNLEYFKQGVRVGIQLLEEINEVYI